jgi:membrane protein YqaA with SNARE-associated domain
MLGDPIFDFFYGMGYIGMITALLLIFIVDATIFPALPELFAVIIFLSNPVWEWALVVIAIALLGEVIGNSILYGLARKLKLPKFMTRIMNKYVDFLIVKDEKIILMNRVAPVTPFVGAFMAACNWSYRKSMTYMVLGGMAKYSFLLVLVGAFNVMWTKELATDVTIVMVLIMISISAAAAFFYRRRKFKMGEQGAEEPGKKTNAAGTEEGCGPIEDGKMHSETGPDQEPLGKSG